MSPLRKPPICGNLKKSPKILRLSTAEDRIKIDKKSFNL